MAMNPNSLMADLRMKSDKELHDFATLNKNDPFLFPLAFQESQMRKRVRSAQQAQMAGQEQPKVVDQELAQMAPTPVMSGYGVPVTAGDGSPVMSGGLPEDSGIAQIPVPNLEKMAGGGIVAFEEGGEVPRFNDRGLVNNMGGVSAIPYYMAGPSAERDRLNALPGKWWDEGTAALGRGFDAFTAGTTMDMDRKQKAEKAQKEADKAKLAAVMQGMPESTVKGFSDTTELDKMIEGEAPTTSAGKKEGKKEAGAGAGAVGPKQPAPAAPSTDTALKTALNAATGVEALLPAKRKAREKDEFLAEREEISKPVWAKAEGMINKEKDRLNEGKEQDFYMALIEGGLAAAGATGPNALQNIAQGFSKGASSYSRALKDFRKAAQENSKMELEMERARAAEKRGDIDAFQRHTETVESQNADIDKLKTSGLFQLANTNLSGQYQLKASANSAAAQIAAAKLPGAQERLFSTLGGGDVNKGLKIFQEAQTDKTGAAYAKLYSDYAANADKSGADKMSPVEFAQNMQQFMSAMQGGGFQPKPTNSTVRTLPSN